MDNYVQILISASSVTFSKFIVKGYARNDFGEISFKKGDVVFIKESFYKQHENRADVVPVVFSLKPLEVDTNNEIDEKINDLEVDTNKKKKNSKKNKKSEEIENNSENVFLEVPQN